MTQEHPQRICADCQTPLARVAATVRGEPFCEDCAPDAVREAYE
jgi:endogenous inhibitor of DNA gyrase (YacG/DUF329 family)